LRLDLYLVQNKLANSRTQAQDFIQNGYVYALQNEVKLVLSKSNYIVKESDKIIVEANRLQKYVSRAGLKLEAALKHLNLNVKDKVVLDVGQSTGGFTDCLLQHGAKQIVGIDVGHGQLADPLKKHPQVVSFENLNAKDLAVNTAFLRTVPVNQFDLIVADVSFISLTKIIPSITNFINEGGEFLLLVKPQFECGRENLDENGLVKDPAIFKQVEQTISEKALQSFKNVTAYFPCEVLGKDGNQEFFIYGKKCN